MRVQLPMPSNVVLAPDDPLSKWAGRLTQESVAAIWWSCSGVYPAPRSPGRKSGRHRFRLPRRRMPPQSPHFIVLRVNGVIPNGIGVVLDSQNHLLIPRFVDKAACRIPHPGGDRRWPMGDGEIRRVRRASGSDPAAIGYADQNESRRRFPASSPELGTLLLVMCAESGERIVWRCGKGGSRMFRRW